MTERSRFLALAITLVWLASTAVETHAQSSTRGATQQRSAFTQNRLKQITSRSNASRFSSSRFRNQTVSRTVPQYNYSTINRNLSSRLNRPAKPFSNISRGPSTTPYLGLSRPFGGVSDIYDVRRQANQQRTNQRQQSQNVALQSQLNQLAAKGPYSPQGSETLAPTGHAAVFLNDGGYRMNYGGYFQK